MRQCIYAFVFTFLPAIIICQNVGVHLSNPAHPLHVNEPTGSILNSYDPIIFGEYTSIGATNDVIGVKGYSRPSDYYGIGGLFEGGYTGVSATVNPTGGLFYFGTMSIVNGGTGTNYGLYGSAIGAGVNWAGYFDQGNVFIQNKLSIGHSNPSWPIDVKNDQAVAKLESTTSANGSVIELKNSALPSTYLGAINFSNGEGEFPGQISYKSIDQFAFRVGGTEKMTLNDQLLWIGSPGSFSDGVQVWKLSPGVTNIAIQGTAAGATTNWAGYFGLGNVYVADELRIGSETGAAGYQVSVDGKIMCEELKVQLNANWPDYVFEQDYPLPSIDKLEREIRDLGHLPGIPSAEEVQNGFEIGEMQRLLLEKTEELTLYIIQLHRENQKLKNEIHALGVEFAQKNK